MDNPFQPGISPHLIPNPPGEIPEAQEAGDAAAGMSPFSEPQDVDQIIQNLTLDRPLKLFIPNRDKMPDWQFRIINSIPSEIADAHNKGFKEVTDPEMVKLFRDLVAGTDKDGKAFRPILVARPKKVGDHISERNRKQLRSLYAGMDPRNKEINSKYAENVTTGTDASKGSFTGAAWNIRLK